jgi:hypothetical protein
MMCWQLRRRNGSNRNEDRIVEWVAHVAAKATEAAAPEATEAATAAPAA